MRAWAAVVALGLFSAITGRGGIDNDTFFRNRFVSSLNCHAHPSEHHPAAVSFREQITKSSGAVASGRKTISNVTNQLRLDVLFKNFRGVHFPFGNWGKLIKFNRGAFPFIAEGLPWEDSKTAFGVRAVRQFWGHFAMFGLDDLLVTISEKFVFAPDSKSRRGPVILENQYKIKNEGVSHLINLFRVDPNRKPGALLGYEQFPRLIQSSAHYAPLAVKHDELKEAHERNNRSQPHHPPVGVFFIAGILGGFGAWITGNRNAYVRAGGFCLIICALLLWLLAW